MTEVPSIILPITLEDSATPCQVVIVWILASCCSCISLFGGLILCTKLIVAVLAIFAGLIVRWRFFQAKGSDYFFDDAPYWNVSGLLLTFSYCPKVQKILSATLPQLKANTLSF